LFEEAPGFHPVLGSRRVGARGARSSFYQPIDCIAIIVDNSMNPSRGPSPQQRLPPFHAGAMKIKKSSVEIPVANTWRDVAE